MSRWNRQQKKRMRRNRERQQLRFQHTESAGTNNGAQKGGQGWFSGVKKFLFGK